MVCASEDCGRKVLARGMCGRHYQRAMAAGEIRPEPRVNGGSCRERGCDGTAVAKGWCRPHYERWRRHGDPNGSSKRKTGQPCSIGDCGGPVTARAMCAKHYMVWKRRGDPNARSDWFNRRFEKVVDASGYVHVFAPNHPNTKRGARIPEHRLVMSEILGRPLLDGENVHHKNGKKDDNRPENLELWVSSQPSGQRAADLVAWAREMLDRYGDLVARGVV